MFTVEAIHFVIFVLVFRIYSFIVQPKNYYYYYYNRFLCGRMFNVQFYIILHVAIDDKTKLSESNQDTLFGIRNM